MALKAIVVAGLLVMSGDASVLPRANYWHGYSKLETLFSFGDSWTKTGFETSGTQPSKNNRLGNPTYPGKTSSNGPNWIGYLTTTYNKSPFLTYNLAYSGAVVDTDIIRNNNNDLTRQVQERFLPKYKRDKAFHASTSLFAIWMGINDVMKGDLYNKPETLDKIFKTYSGEIAALYKAGARNFLLLTLPPLERAPRVTKKSDSATRIPRIAKAVSEWNSRVRSLQSSIQKNYSKSTVFVYDTYPLMMNVMKKPSTYSETKIYKDTNGFCSAYTKGTEKPDTKSSECKYAANQYLWLNDLHPTDPFHKLLAKDISSFLQKQK
ncbi:hypothetical protein NW768_011854 [Fusarium equiseti]|uniref:Acetylesterase n=1 Tax=Fusarium equiseti TaxID=61235 RepID=A0ABQ8QX26_FUSEQ|nr:hypothetical protein NW768_011854 [Fusarium equiseti]